MAKDFKTNATAGAQSIYDELTKGGSAPKAETPAVKRTKRAKYPSEERLNIAIPAYIKEYLQAAAYRESNAKHTVSITEYICDLVAADMEKHKDD